MSITGHTAIREHFSDLVKKKKFPQTSIFYGPEGIGKKLVACDVARELLKVGHHDLFFLEPTPPKSSSGSEKTKSHLRSNWTIKIEQLNELKSKLTHHPLQGDYQVIIIDEAEKMTVSAANTVLKIIEEPRPTQIFILVTSRLGHILPTLRSRSAKFHFSGLSLSEVKEILSTIPDTQSPDSLSFFYDAFGGSVSMILRAIGSKIDPKVFEEILSSRDQFGRLSKCVKGLLKDDVDLDVFLQCLRTYCLRRRGGRGLSEGEADRLLKKAQRAGLQLAKHIPTEFVLENLFY